MRNAKKELPVEYGTVKCAEISRHPSYGAEDKTEHNVTLRVGHTKQEFDEFLEQLDFEYDAGYGTQELYGTIWCTDGCWYTRGEYDGSEWWTLHRLPDVPEHLQPRRPNEQITLGKAIVMLIGLGLWSLIGVLGMTL